MLFIQYTLYSYLLHNEKQRDLFSPPHQTPTVTAMARVNDDEMSRTRGTQGGEEKRLQGVGEETWNK